MKHLRLILAVSIVLLAAALVGGGQAVVAPVGATGEHIRYFPLSARGASLVPEGFADYYRVPVEVAPNAPHYEPDLQAIVNPGLIAGLSADQQAALEANGFVVVPAEHAAIHDIYLDFNPDTVPLFVTTDAVLHTFHVVYDYALRLAEKESFLAALERLNGALLTAAEADYAVATGPVRDAARQELAFLAVAAQLLNPDGPVPAAIRQEVDQELALIEGHAGFEESPIFGYKEDYSQYVPRGHYTRNADFERYFRAVMWYGRMAFRLTDEDDPEAARRETRAALLLVHALHTTPVGGMNALDVWERIYEPTAFFVGTADDLTVHDYARVARFVYGDLPGPEELALDGQLDRFIDIARQQRAPAIVGGWATDQSDPEVVTQGFRLMGQRFIPDSYIFQQLVYDEVGLHYGTDMPFTRSTEPVRGFPRGLDIPAALGNARALAILEEAGDTAYYGYAEQLEKVRQEFAVLPGQQWTANLYWNWLHSLRPLLEVKGEGYPAFMRSPAWVDKDLHTWLGSWTELRHDTILYTKQSTTVVVTTVPQEPRGYVEPQPAVYARLAALTRQMQAGLRARSLLHAEMALKLDSLEGLLLGLKGMSEKELRGEPLTDAEYTAIRNIGDTLHDLATFSEEVAGEITSAADERMALVADVHTDPNSGQVLEEAVGDAFPIYVIALVDGHQVVTVGGVFSYYEFKQPMNDRLTDEAWQDMDPLPARPAWTGSFIVE
jgi:hypothetical protein